MTDGHKYENVQKQQSYEDLTGQLYVWDADNVVHSSTGAEWMEEADISKTASRLARAS